MDASLRNIAFFSELQHALLMVTEADIASARAFLQAVDSIDAAEYTISHGQLSKDLQALWALYHSASKVVETAENALLSADEAASPAMLEELKRWRAKEVSYNLLIQMCLCREFPISTSDTDRFFLVGADFEVFEKPGTQPAADFSDTVPL